MSTIRRRESARPLPLGLRLCPNCDEARGTTPDGQVSACFCSGLVCHRCGQRVRRPITDYFDASDGNWCHVPYFALLVHRSGCAPRSTSTDDGWTRLAPDPDVLTYQEAVTRLALSELHEGDEVDLVDGDRRIGRSRVDRMQ